MSFAKVSLELGKEGDSSFPTTVTAIFYSFTGKGLLPSCLGVCRYKEE